MNAVWELRVFGTDQRGCMRRKIYTFVIDECGQGYATASAEAKRLAKLDGLTDPRVWAATRVREVPESPRPELPASSAGLWSVR